jgi:hypothetical protein
LNDRRIVGRAEGSHWPPAIFGIATILSLEDIFDRNWPPHFRQLLLTATGPLQRGRGQKDLAFGIWENFRALIASLGHNVSTGCNPSLQYRELSTDFWEIGDVTNRVGHCRRSDLIADIIAIEKDSSPIPTEIDSLGKPNHSLDVGEINLGSNRSQGDGPIHRTGIQKVKAKLLSNLPCDATFSRAGRPIDRHNHVACSRLLS